MRLSSFIALLVTAACGESPSGGPDATAGWSQALGVYSDCTGDLGFASGMGGTLTLGETGSGVLTVTYAPATDASFSLEFTSTSATSATLALPGQTMPWGALCWSGSMMTDSGLPIDPGATQLTLQLTSGALTYDAETVFLSVVGTPETDATCEGRSTGTLTCSKE